MMQTTRKTVFSPKAVGLLALAAIVALAYAGSPLGPRTVYAATTLVVTTTDDDLTDDDACSLREAVIFANTGGVGAEDFCGTDGGGPYTIQLTDGEIYTLEIGAADEDAAAEGDLDIDAAVLIEVASGGQAIVQQRDDVDDRVFQVLPGASLTLTGITVRNGEVESNDGGGIFSDGNLTLIDTTVTGNFASNSGGGIFSFGDVTLTNSTVSHNEAEEGDGGGIYNAGATLTLTGSSVTANSSDDGGGGIYNGDFDDAKGVLSLTESTVSGNHAGLDGGGIKNDNENTATLTDSIVSDNTAASDGGGIFNDAATLTLVRSTVSGNGANSESGGIHNNIDDIEDEATATLIQSTVSGNTAGEMGGGFSNDGLLVITNSTVSGNSAVTVGGGILNDTEGDEQIVVGETILTNVTIAFNTANAGGGLYEQFPDVPGTFILTNTVIADNTGGDCGGNQAGFQSQGNNLASDNTCTSLTGTGDQTNANAGLGPLNVNAPGTTATHALMSDSDAIDAGNATVCAGDPVDGVDQRGVARPQDGDADGTAVCDIGAYELQPAALTVTKACVGEGFNATFELSVGDQTQPVACGGTAVFMGLVPGDYTLSETISGPDAAGFVAAIGCEGGTPVVADSAPVIVPAPPAGVACVVINFFEPDGVLDEEDVLALLCACLLDLEIDIGNDNTNTIGIDNDNQNNNANDNDNTNDNGNANDNENTNENENTQDQDNDQGQDNANDQTNNIDSSPEVNIDFGD